MRLSQATQVYLQAKVAKGIKRTTEAWYRQRLARLCAFLDDCEISEIDAMALRLFLVDLRTQKKLWGKHPYRGTREGQLSPYTVHSYFRAIRQFFGWLVKEGALETDPTRSVEIMAPPQTGAKEVTTETIRAMLAACTEPTPGQQRDRAMILFLTDTGCRVGGAVSLRLRDLDLDDRRAMVLEKGSKFRQVWLTPRTIRAMRAYLDHRLVESEWVFPSLKTGDRMLASSVNHILKRVAQRAGLENVRTNPHGFRHHFARTYVLKGGDMGTLSDILGHSDIDVTKKFYARFRPGELQAKHDRFSPVGDLDLDDKGADNDHGTRA